MRRNWAQNSLGANSHELEKEVVDNSVCCQIRINDSSRADLGHACETERVYTWDSQCKYARHAVDPATGELTSAVVSYINENTRIDGSSGFSKPWWDLKHLITNGNLWQIVNGALPAGWETTYWNHNWK